MALQFRRGLDSDRLTITPTAGEPIWSTDTEKLYVGDGTTAGGIAVGNDSAEINVIIQNKLGNVSGNIIPDTDSAYDLGSPTNKFKDLYLSGNSIYLGDNLILRNDAGTLVAEDSSATPVSISLSNNTTSDLAEGTNLYFTDARADARVTTTADSSYVQARQIKYTNADFADSSFVTAQINNLIDGAPGTLDTLNEIAAALNDDDSAYSTLVGLINAKSDLDSTDAIALIDSAYIQARQTTYDFLDSSEAIALIDSAYIQARQVDLQRDSAFIRGIFSASGDLTYNSGTGEFSIDVESVYTADNFDSDYILAKDSANTAVERNKHDATTKNFSVTVASKTTDHVYNGSGSGNGYVIDGTQSPVVQLQIGRTYRFTLSSSDMSSHPFRFYYDAARNTQYTTNVTTTSTYAEIEITESTPPVLHYQCSAHGYMGHALVIGTRNLTGFTTSDLSEGSNQYYTEARVQSLIDSAYVAERTTAGTDSAAIINLIDSAYVAARTTAGTDSAAIINLIDSAYVQERQVYSSDILLQIDSDLTTTDSAQIVHSFNKSTYRTVKYTAQLENDDTSSYHAEEILLTHDGTNIAISSYSKLTLDSDLGEFDAQITGNNVELTLTPTNANTHVKLRAIAMSEGAANSNGLIIAVDSDLTTTDSAQTIHTFDKTNFRTLKYVAQLAVASTGDYHAQEILLTHNGTNVAMTGYAKILLDSDLGTFDALINGNNVELKLSPTKANTNVKLRAIRTLA